MVQPVFKTDVTYSRVKLVSFRFGFFFSSKGDMYVLECFVFYASVHFATFI